MLSTLLSVLLFGAVPAEVKTSETPQTRLYVQTTPPGATIKVDGQSQGTAPKTIVIPPGTRRITVEVELEGRPSQRRELTVQGGRVTRVEFNFGPPATSGTGVPPASGEIADAWKAPQGKWKVVRVEKGKGGDQAWGWILQWWNWVRGGWDADPSNTYRFEFHDDGRTVVLHSRLPETRIIQFRVDPRATPKTIDFYGLDGYRPGTDGRIGLGIYEIESNRLKICLTANVPGPQGRAQRPTGFSVSPDSADFLFVLEPYTPPPELQTVAGTWEIAKHIRDGKAVSHAGPPTFRRWTFSGDLVWMNDERHGRFVLNATAQPKQITWAGWEGVNEKITEQHFNGIYKLDGDRLTIAYRQNGPRPDKFESLPDSGVTLLEFERATPTTSPRPDTTKTGKSQVPSGQGGTPWLTGKAGAAGSAQSKRAGKPASPAAVPNTEVMESQFLYLVISADGNRVRGYSPKFGWDEYTAAKGVALKAVINPGSGKVAALQPIRGNVSEIAAFSAKTGKWAKHALKGTFPAADVVPYVSDDIVCYQFGGRAYAFSVTGQWDELATKAYVSLSNVMASVETKGHFSVFSAHTGRWSSIETQGFVYMTDTTARAETNSGIMIYSALTGRWTNINTKK